MAEARRRALEWCRGVDGVEAEVYVTAPGARIEESHPLVGSLAAAHAEVFGGEPERDVTRWFSDASVLSRYGIATVNYGTSSGLPDPELGENLEIDGLVKTAEVYARAILIPEEFKPQGFDRGCGALVIWTRRFWPEGKKRP